MSELINIAIDGYSSTGKSTLAKDLAQRLNYRYIDTGAMYRAVTLFALKKEYVSGNGISEKLLDELPALNLEFHFLAEKNVSEIFLNNKNVEEEIREMDVARYVSQIAAISEVRKFLVNKQQELAIRKGVVMDGRDIGTVVLPNAELKVFVTASESVRVERRYQELLSKDKKVSRQEVRANLKERDLIDTTRKDSPLRQAEAARLLDNSDLSRTEQLDLVLSWVKEIRISNEA